MKNTKKSNFLSLQVKREIIEKLERGERLTDLARQYDVAKSTISSIMQKKEKIYKVVTNSTDLCFVNRKTLRNGEYPRMEQSLYEWFLEQCYKNLTVGGDMLKEKAKELHKSIQEKEGDFTASSGWLNGFKSRYGIRFLKVRGWKHISSQEKDSLEEDTSYSIVDDNDAEIEECDIKLEDVEIHDQDEAQVMESYSPPRKKSLASTPPIRLRKDLRAIPATEFCLASIQSSASKDVAPQLPDVTISGNEQKFSPVMIDRSPSLCSETGRTNERWSFQPDADYSSCTGLCRKREHEANNLERSITKLQKTIDSKLEQDKDDEFDLFGKSIAIQLKRMPLERALRCQESLQRVMNQERLQQNK